MIRIVHTLQALSQNADLIRREEAMRALRSVVVLVSICCTRWTAAYAAEPQVETGGRAVVQAIYPAPNAFDPYSIVSVCPLGDSWSVFWHTPPGVDVEKANRARSQLKAPDFQDCLAMLVWTDPATLRVVENAIQSRDPSKTKHRMDLKAADASIVAVQKRWTEFGVGDAIGEVAETGSRGDRVAKVLAACERLSASENEPKK